MDTKLKEGIHSTNFKIIELYNKISSDLLVTRPDFQRKLVWKKQHKYHFIETILNNFPFPEIYIASSEIDVESLIAKEIVVDGQQRLSTIVDYIKGIGDFEHQTRITAFDSLTTEEKKEFLNYPVAVKDLKDMNDNIIKEIFQRINNTEYSLNTVEKTNAQYGDGEFAILCKQIIDTDYKPTIDQTDIVLNNAIKHKLNFFFDNNRIFSDSDKARMFDFQYSMLVISTYLEGDYFGRSLKIEYYLKRYNASFEPHNEVLGLLLNSVDIISRLRLDKSSYWFNKANLFTLLIEFSKVDSEDLNLEKLETSLLELEYKNDLYFSEEEYEAGDITDDERKYFEEARHGSHEKAARVHRGKVISTLVSNAMINKNQTVLFKTSEHEREGVLRQHSLKYVLIKPTKTALEKSIMDATASVRDFFQINEIHDYHRQENGPENKVKKEIEFIFENSTQNEQLSLYRATNRGDARLSISNLKSYAHADDTLALIVKNNSLYLLNITSLDINNMIGEPSPFNNLLKN